MTQYTSRGKLSRDTLRRTLFHSQLSAKCPCHPYRRDLLFDRVATRYRLPIRQFPRHDPILVPKIKNLQPTQVPHSAGGAGLVSGSVATSLGHTETQTINTNQSNSETHHDTGYGDRIASSGKPLRLRSNYRREQYVVISSHQWKSVDSTRPHRSTSTARQLRHHSCERGV